MNYVEDMLEKEGKLRVAKKEYKESLILAQTNCEHPRIVEGKRFRSSVLNDSLPFRVCRDCGYAEEGEGYSLLTRGSYNEDELEIPEVDRDVACRLARGSIVPYENHRAVQKGEKDLADILR